MIGVVSWHVKAGLRRYPTFPARVGATNGVSRSGKIALVIALGSHVSMVISSQKARARVSGREVEYLGVRVELRHDGTDRSDLRHEIVPLALISRGIGQITDVKHEIRLRKASAEGSQNMSCWRSRFPT